MQELPLNDEGWKALHSIRECCPSAFIAGGALRDMEMGLPISDVDVYIHAQEANLWMIKNVDIAQQLNTDLSYLGDFNAYRYEPCKTLNIMVIHEALEEVSTREWLCHKFCCGLSRIYMDLHDMIVHKHSTYIRDKKEHSLTWNPDYSPSYQHKMEKKFPTFNNQYMYRRARNDSRSWH